MDVHGPTNYNAYDDGGRNARATVRAIPLLKEGASAKAENTTTAPASRAVPQDVVEISPEARANASRTEPAQSFAVGSGYDSAKKSLAQVKQDMRALFDVRIEETGVDFANTATSGPKTDEVFGDITDSRALFAVFNDTSDTFTQHEKDTAYYVMLRMYQKDQSSVQREPVDHVDLGTAQGIADFYEQASPEEQAEFESAKERAVEQAVHAALRGQGNPSPEGFYDTLFSDRNFLSDKHFKTGDEKVNDLIERLGLGKELSENRAQSLAEALNTNDDDTANRPSLAQELAKE